MTLDEFHAKFMAILDQDCAKGYMATHRTLTDNEAEKICQHIYEVVHAQTFSSSEGALFQALWQTRRGYDSHQDRAKRMAAILSGG